MPPRESHANKQSLLERKAGWVAAGWVASLLLFLFAPVIFSGHRLAFRDIATFYIPLYESITHRVWAGDWPMWNALDQWGTPVIGESTTAMFYPPRWLFFTGVRTDVGFTLYTISHLAFAAAGVYRASRREGLDVSSACLATIAYCGCGPVLFLYCNPPFLVGAAWLPWCIGSLRECVKNLVYARVDGKEIAWCASCLAMPILAGDPQTSIHALLIATLFALWRFGSSVAMSRVNVLGRNVDQKLMSESHYRGFQRAITGIGLITAFTLSLSAVQVVASLQWSRNSERTYESPPGITRWLGGEASLSSRGRAWYEAAEAGTHSHALYDFSLSPLHTVGFAFPGALGRLQPENANIAGLLDPRERVWTPTLYLGLMPLLLFFSTLIARRMGFWEWTAIIGLLVALGPHLGLELFQRITPGGEAATTIRNPTGSPYWYLVTFLPGYSGFRFPAKWLPVVALGVAMAAGKAFHLDATNRRSFRILLVTFLIFGIGLFIASLLPASLRWMVKQVQMNPSLVAGVYGPFRFDMALESLRTAGIHVILAAVIAWGSWRWLRSRHQNDRGSTHPFFAFIVLGLTVVDLIVANEPYLASVPIKTSDSRRAVALKSTPSFPRKLWRTEVSDAPPLPWIETSSLDRTREFETSVARSDSGRWNLLDELAIANSQPSIANYLVIEMFSVANELIEKLPADEKGEAFTNLLIFSHIHGILTPGPIANSGSSRDGRQSVIAERVIQSVEGTQPPYRIISQPRFITKPNTQERLQLWKQILSKAIKSSTSVPTYIIADTNESASARDDSETALGAAAFAGEGQAVSCVEWSHDQAAFEVTSKSNCWLFVDVFQDGNWKATLASMDDPNKKLDAIPMSANLIGQALQVPPGRWSITMSYWPSSFLPSAVASGLAWLIAVAVILQHNQSPLTSKKPS